MFMYGTHVRLYYYDMIRRAVPHRIKRAAGIISPVVASPGIRRGVEMKTRVFIMNVMARLSFIFTIYYCTYGGNLQRIQYT